MELVRQVATTATRAISNVVCCSCSCCSSSSSSEIKLCLSLCILHIPLLVLPSPPFNKQYNLGKRNQAQRSKADVSKTSSHQHNLAINGRGIIHTHVLFEDGSFQLWPPRQEVDGTMSSRSNFAASSMQKNHGTNPSHLHSAALFTVLRKITKMAGSVKCTATAPLVQGSSVDTMGIGGSGDWTGGGSW